MSNLPEPTLQNDRADILDVLRGFAILGIFLDNLMGFTGWGFLNMAQREAIPTFLVDMGLGLFEFVFVHGKFYSLFSLLFGIGFSIILVRSNQRGVSPLKIFCRRLIVLMFIGVFHLYGLWEGDILLLYALLGFVLPLFNKCSNKGLLVWAIVLILSPIVIDILKVIFQTRIAGSLEDFASAIDKKNGLPAYADPAFSKYLFDTNTGWEHWRIWQSTAWIYRYSYIIESNRMPKVLGMFLLGLYAGRKMMYTQLESYTGLFKKLRFWGFLIGIPANLAMAYFEFDDYSIPKPLGLLDTFFYAAGVVPLSLAYVSSICLFWIKTRGKNKWTVLAPAGRMALTNYLMQTLVGIGLFYGVGLGLGGDVGPAFYFPVAITVFTLQVMYSNWWLARFNYGPVEWVWRQLTYGKRLPLRKRILE